MVAAGSKKEDRLGEKGEQSGAGTTGYKVQRSTDGVVMVRRPVRQESGLLAVVNYKK